MIRLLLSLSRLLTAVLILIGVLLVLSWIAGLHRPHPRGAPVIEQVRGLAELALLEVQISDVRVSELRGYIGSTSLVLIVHGRARIGSDLTQASFTKLDPQQQRAVIAIPKPTVISATLDHERTNVYTLSRHGLWRLLPTDAGETKVIDQAMLDAQRQVREAADRHELRLQAKKQAELILQQVFRPLGWTIEVVWHETD